MKTSYDHRRTQPLVAVPIDKIRLGENFIDDEYFMHKHLLPYMSGKKKSLLTRIDSERILDGFIVNGEVKSNIRVNSVELIAEMIRLGSRPVIDAYKNFNRGGLPEFSCGDNENSLGAYKKLGFRAVPCLLHGSGKNGLIEAFIETIGSGQSFRIVGVGRNQPKTVSALNCDDADSLCSRVLDLIALIEAGAAAFCIKEKDQYTGYNEVITSILVDMRELVECLKWAFKQEKSIVCSITIRSLFEMLINYYIDWISPDYLGGALQLSSAVGNSAKNKAIANSYPRTKEILIDFKKYSERSSKKLDSRLWVRFFMMNSTEYCPQLHIKIIISVRIPLTGEER